MIKQMENTLNIYIIEIQYCPICGKGWFGKKYLEKIENKQDEIKGIWYYKCKRCGCKIKIYTPQYEKYKEVFG